MNGQKLDKNSHLPKRASETAPIPMFDGDSHRVSCMFEVRQCCSCYVGNGASDHCLLCGGSALNHFLEERR